MATEARMPVIASAQDNEEQRKWIVPHWTLTGLLMLQVGASAILLIVRPPMVTAVVQRLGYPPYFPIFLGIAKLLATIAIAQPWSETLREWAYAGLTFDVIAAALSHLASHDSAGEAAGPFLIMALVAVSYFAHFRTKRHRSRVVTNSRTFRS